MAGYWWGNRFHSTEVEVSKRSILFVLVTLSVICVAALSGCGCAESTTTESSVSAGATEVTLLVEDLVVGEGEAAASGDTVTVEYTGWLEDGTKFDSSLDRGTPFVFTLGANEVIPGWDLGVEGMQVGGKRKLTIPPELGYGASGAGELVPPNATLVFEVELLSID